MPCMHCVVTWVHVYMNTACFIFTKLLAWLTRLSYRAHLNLMTIVVNDMTVY